MLIAHYYPNAWNNYMGRFMNYVEGHDFMSNWCNESVDLIYCGSVSQLDKAMAAKEVFKKPIICWVWDIPYRWGEWCRTEDEARANRWRDGYIDSVILNLNKCDKVISSSKYTQRVLKEKFGLDSEQIYFYIDADELDRWGLMNQAVNPNYIIQISRFALNKRFDLSIRVAQSLGQKLACVGIGNFTHLRALAVDLSANVAFYQNIMRTTTIGLLKQAKVLVSPSVFEGWGMTPIEAIYCGIPALVSDLEVFKEVYGDCMVYHKKDDFSSMREKLDRILKDKQLRAKIVKDCKPLISEFTIPKFAKRWEKAIR
jgi:glycosyltransferase involved in cell wall biosynthesis